MKEGMGAIIMAMPELMNGISDGIAEQRLGREMLELCMENKFERLEDKVKDVPSSRLIWLRFFDKIIFFSTFCEDANFNRKYGGV